MKSKDYYAAPTSQATHSLPGLVVRGTLGPQSGPERLLPKLDAAVTATTTLSTEVVASFSK